jgi:hypothetical protein
MAAYVQFDLALDARTPDLLARQDTCSNSSGETDKGTLILIGTAIDGANP